ncbi:lipopolysaccharide biosynthesis protein [Marinobacter nauticus]|uniref:lipopolysaccharide biosynthesis protein n=1 Tax=Marinobacter nauticus TaxID=2743 RepID=UPI001C997622|nr:oligosaccharide flippase family protein [Marinobacter nauticus]MBY5937647.1 oligosaccharide flippase family protein [Marinobacter nauticus]MBY5954875.1 oligosaccharide flippase family protein [Marinobacter nauticus]MBY6008668.1 oligosaccharide flippase family protein [Marinobacter nauticus]
MIRGLQGLLRRNAFARGVSVLVGGTAAAQLLIILASPLLTRLYTPEDFGLLGVFTSLLALFTVIASLRYELAIPLPESDTEAANVLVLSLLVVLIITSICGLAVFFAGKHIALVLDTPALVNYAWMLPIGVLLVGVYQVFNYWATRQKAFGDVARSRVSQTVSMLAVQFIASGFGGIALLLGQVGGQGVGSLRLARAARSHRDFYCWTWRGVRQAAIRYKQFPIFSTWSGLFNTAGTQLPPLMFAAFFSSGAAGVYVLAHRVLALPMSILGDAIGKVFFSNAADAYREDRLAPLVRNVHYMLAQIAMPPTVLLVFTGPELFALVFGENWRQSGEFSRYMAPWLYMVFITSPLSTVFLVLERENIGMYFQGTLLLFRILAIFVGAILLGDLITTVALFTIVSTLYYFGFLAWICLASGNNMMDLIGPTRVALFKSGLCISPVLLTLNIFSENSYWLYFGIFVTVIMFFLYYKSAVKKVALI